MLYEKNLEAEVTRMIEMNKVKNESLKTINQTQMLKCDNTNHIPTSMTNVATRIDNTVNDILNYQFDFSVNNVEKSNDLNHVTHLRFYFDKGIYPEHRLGEAHMEVNVFIDSKRQCGYVVEYAYQKKWADAFCLPTLNDVDNYLHNILIYSLDSPIEDSKTANALRRFWLYQIQDELPKVKLKLDNPIFYKILDNVKTSMTKEDKMGDVEITYRELFSFFDEVKAQHITEKTQIVQNWISYSDERFIENALATHQNIYQLEQNLKPLDTETYQKLLKKITKDGYFKRHITNIYEVNAKRPQKRGLKRMQGVHGTPNRTVMSILLNGLQTNATLRKNAVSHHYTGSGLGEGVYFSKITQASKGSNYSKGHGEKRYMFIADIDYDESAVYHVNNYGKSGDPSKHSLVHGHGVGARGIDEIVALHDDQINVRYIVEMI